MASVPQANNLAPVYLPAQDSIAKQYSIVESRRQLGTTIGQTLQKYGMAHNSPIAVLKGQQILACAGRDNLYVASDLHTKDAELFNGNGTLASCGVRMCPSCTAMRARHTRRTGRALLEYVNANWRELKAKQRAEYVAKLQKAKRVSTREHYKAKIQSLDKYGLKWRFMTLTPFHVPGVSLVKCLEVVIDAYTYLQRHKAFKENVQVSMRGTEFTLGKAWEKAGRKWSIDFDGYHPHHHVMMYSAFVDFDEMRSAWTECLMKAYSEHGIAIQPETVGSRDGKANLQILTIKTSGIQNGKEVSLRTALQETLKYQTKGNTWASLPAGELVKAAEVSKWPRIFGVTGVTRAELGLVKATKPHMDKERFEAKEQVADVAPYLDTTGITSSQIELLRFYSGTKLTKLVGVLPATQLQRLRAARWARQQAARRRGLAHKYPWASFTTLNGEVFAYSGFMCSGNGETLTFVAAKHVDTLPSPTGTQAVRIVPILKNKHYPLVEPVTAKLTAKAFPVVAVLPKRDEWASPSAASPAGVGLSLANRAQVVLPRREC